LRAKATSRKGREAGPVASARVVHGPDLPMKLDDILRRAEDLYADSELRTLARWKEAGGAVVGCAPAYVPTEIIDAAGALPACLLGAGPGLEVVQGDAYFQSAICHLPRTLVDLGLRGALDALDLLVVPATCDVMRNLTGMWRVLFANRPVRYLDLPQRFDDDGFRFYRGQLGELLADVEARVGRPVAESALRESIRVHNARRRALRELADLRAAEPWRVPTSELWLVVRAGALLPPREHGSLLRSYLGACRETERPPLDLARVVLTGAFCEQPPLGFLRTLERAGCAIVEDDFLLGMKWLRDDVAEDGDPLTALARAYLDKSPLAPCRFEGADRRPDALVRTVRARRAAGVILASPSFCDPALLDRPGLLGGLERASIPSVQLQYAENSVDFGSVREQAGTFADALRLWEE
jgi:benzoyl-CoA reductase subunit C